jgi:chaperonin GroES
MMEIDALTKESKGKEIPDHIPMVRDIEPEEEKVEFTPDTVQEDESLMEMIPKPTGYRLMILPFSRKAKTKGGILLHNDTLEKERIATNVGFVVSLGPDAYKDKAKFPNGAWCQERDWVIFGRYAGARIKIDGGDLRLLNDDEVLAVVDNPEDVQ